MCDAQNSRVPPNPGLRQRRRAAALASAFRSRASFFSRVAISRAACLAANLSAFTSSLRARASSLGSGRRLTLAVSSGTREVPFVGVADARRRVSSGARASARGLVVVASARVGCSTALGRARCPTAATDASWRARGASSFSASASAKASASSASTMYCCTSAKRPSERPAFGCGADPFPRCVMGRTFRNTDVNVTRQTTPREVRTGRLTDRYWVFQTIG